MTREPYRLITYIFTNNSGGNAATILEQRFAHREDRARCKEALRARLAVTAFVEYDDTHDLPEATPWTTDAPLVRGY